MNSWDNLTIAELVKKNILEQPMDGNHGEIHPKGDDFVESGIPFVMASDIENSKINFKTCSYIKKEQADNLRKGFSITGDVLLTHKATIGRTAIVPDIDYPFLMLTPQVTYYRVKDKKKLNNKFLKYCFDTKAFQETIKNWAGAGSTRAYIGITQQQNLKIHLPDINTQQKISSVLSSLDAKIELNNRINAKLETIAKLIYDYWFVQFDFPNEQGKPYKSSGGLMVYNKELKREIPEGWEVKKLKHYLKHNYNSISKSKSFKKIKYLDTSSLTENYISSLQALNCAKDKIPSRAQRIVSKNDILYSTVRPNQCHFGLIKEPVENMIASTGFVQLSSKEQGISNDLIYTFITSDWVTSRLQQIAELSVSAYPSISPTDLLELRIALPKDKSCKILKSINKQLDDSYTLISNNHKQNQQLASLRDWLLPMLMNGQVTVKEAEEKVIDLGMVAEPGEEYVNNKRNQ